MSNVQTLNERELSNEEVIRRIERYINNPPENSRVFRITPDTAEHLLSTFNVSNRPKKPIKINQYADDMASEEWFLTGDTIKFSDERVLRDGQNRLMACVRSGKEFLTHIVFGIPDQAFAKLDQGKPRSGGDVLHDAGYVDSTHLAAAVRWAWLLDEGTVEQRGSLTPHETLNLLRERYGNLPKFTKNAARINHINMRLPKSLIAGLLYHFDRANSAKAKEWATAYEAGKERGIYLPLKHADDIIKKHASASFGRIHDVVRAAILIKGWNAFVVGQKTKPESLDWNKTTEDFPAILKG